jgi:outer membrane biogenesis lipoprotein LolB|tara:strand:+ start:1856 stop:2101 length:246 start_codon:yes stop_codon:yes gene_type:complete
MTPMFYRNCFAASLLVLACSQLTACNSDSSSESSDHQESGIWQPKPGTSWHWQLENYDNLDISKDAEALRVSMVLNQRFLR